MKKRKAAADVDLRFTFRFASEADKLHFDECAKRANLSRSEYISALIRGKRVKATPYAELVSELVRLGVSIRDYQERNGDIGAVEYRQALQALTDVLGVVTVRLEMHRSR